MGGKKRSPERFSLKFFRWDKKSVLWKAFHSSSVSQTPSLQVLPLRMQAQWQANLFTSVGVERWGGFCQQSIQASFKPKSWGFRALTLWGKVCVFYWTFNQVKGGGKALKRKLPHKVFAVMIFGWWRQLGQNRLCVMALINHFLPDLLTTTAKHQKQHDPVLPAGQGVSSQQDTPLLTTHESTNSTGLLCRPSAVVWSLNQHSGSPSPAFSCTTPDLHNKAPEGLSSLKCEPMLWPFPSYPKGISYYPAFTLLWSALSTVHPSQSQDIRSLALGFVPRQWWPFKCLCQTKFFPLITKSPASHELWRKGKLLHVYVPMHAQFLRSQSALSCGSLCTKNWPSRTLPGLCTAGALQSSDQGRSFLWGGGEATVSGKGLSLSC